MTAQNPPVVILGAGAFGTALAIALTETGESLLWSRPGPRFDSLCEHRENRHYLPGLPFPTSLGLCSDLSKLAPGALVLLAVPTQSLRAVLTQHRAHLPRHHLIVCCKGVELDTQLLPSEVVADVVPGAKCSVLTGPSFAADIARHKPTALTLACAEPDADLLQARLSQPSLRLYLTDDLIGAQLGGALKNVIAIAAGIAIGAGLGESARAALITRGFAEITRFAAAKGARLETLFGLSGFGDLVLTCSSMQSRNFQHGYAIGAGQPLRADVTTEGVMTAHALAASQKAEDLPITHMVSNLLKQNCSLEQAIEALLSRPLKREFAAN